jgi:hypothetical protein
MAGDYGSKPDGRHNRENTLWDLPWKHSTGWHRDLYLTGSAHGSYTDAEPIDHPSKKYPDLTFIK